MDVDRRWTDVCGQTKVGNATSKATMLQQQQLATLYVLQFATALQFATFQALQFVTLQALQLVVMLQLATTFQEQTFFSFSFHLLVVSSVLAFALEVATIIDVEELIIEEWNLICFFKLVPQAPISINSSS
jgi:hypothetical protein